MLFIPILVTDPIAQRQTVCSTRKRNDRRTETMKLMGVDEDFLEVARDTACRTLGVRGSGSIVLVHALTGCTIESRCAVISQTMR